MQVLRAVHEVDGNLRQAQMIKRLLQLATNGFFNRCLAALLIGTQFVLGYDQLVFGLSFFEIAA